MSICLDVGSLPMGGSTQQKREAATMHLRGLPHCATWVWSDGAVVGGTHDGGADVFIEDPDAETHILREPAGRLCTSFRAEMVTLRAALLHLVDHPIREPTVICTYSQSALATLRSGPVTKTTPLGCEIWAAVRELTARGEQVVFQWVPLPSHCELPGNDRADELAREASALPQENAPADVRTVHRAAARVARDQWIQSWPRSWHWELMDVHLPQPVASSQSVDVHQLRSRHWSASSQYMHRIGQNPAHHCPQCNEVTCDEARCRICRLAADTQMHILMECPALMGTRLSGSLATSYRRWRK